MQKILVIEDTKDLREDVVEMLNLEGFHAVGAENGLEGITAARRERPDLIVCDIMMPELDGYGVLERVREDPKTVSIPFIFLTAKTDRIDQRHGMVLGADDYLTKPFQANELLESIHSQLEKRRRMKASVGKLMEELQNNIITALPHELRTPLNTIIGFSEMLMMEAHRLKPDQVADWSAHINTSGHRLYRLVENYLYYVRTQVNSQTQQQLEAYKAARMDGASMVIYSQAMKLAQRAEREDDLQLEIAELPTVHIMQQDLIKIVDEMLDNAFKFSTPGAPVQMVVNLEDGYFTMSFRDHGRGMTTDEVDAIGAYMQFGRDLYEQQGMGLGLAIVRRLCELYNGEFNIQSVPDEGTLVTVTLRTA